MVDYDNNHLNKNVNNCIVTVTIVIILPTAELKGPILLTPPSSYATLLVTGKSPWRQLEPPVINAPGNESVVEDDARAL